LLDFSSASVFEDECAVLHVVYPGADTLITVGTKKVKQSRKMAQKKGQRKIFKIPIENSKKKQELTQ